MLPVCHIWQKNANPHDGQGPAGRLTSWSVAAGHQLRSVKAGRRRLISRQHLDEFLAGDAA
jgi:hypothetical protein